MRFSVIECLFWSKANREKVWRTERWTFAAFQPGIPSSGLHFDPFFLVFILHLYYYGHRVLGDYIQYNESQLKGIFKNGDVSQLTLCHEIWYKHSWSAQDEAYWIKWSPFSLVSTWGWCILVKCLNNSSIDCQWLWCRCSWCGLMTSLNCTNWTLFIMQHDV